MEVTGPLLAPNLGPCPGRDDVVKCVDDTCQPVPPQRTVDWSGWDCCNYWDSSQNVWCNDVVRTDVVNPEKFKYQQYRYQLYARPTQFNCDDVSHPSQPGFGDRQNTLHENGRTYFPPQTDVRGLRQTTYIPVLPTKPGGERDVTFPMTPRTMGQPDVTTACCVPVIPCQPGYKNLTTNLKPTARQICEAGSYCSPNQLESNVCTGAVTSHAQQPAQHHAHQHTGHGGPPPQYITPPSNVAGSGCVGLPDTFPPVRQRQSLPGPAPCAPPSASLHNIPHYDGSLPGTQCVQDMEDMCLVDTDDGTAQTSSSARCLNSSTFRYKDRVDRLIKAKHESPEAKTTRLHTMFGAYGAGMTSKPTLRRQLRGPKDSLTLQGNGFSWSYPRHQNRLCYVLERNPRC